MSCSTNMQVLGTRKRELLKHPIGLFTNTMDNISLLKELESCAST